MSSKQALDAFQQPFMRLRVGMRATFGQLGIKPPAGAKTPKRVGIPTTLIASHGCVGKVWRTPGASNKVAATTFGGAKVELVSMDERYRSGSRPVPDTSRRTRLSSGSKASRRTQGDGSGTRVLTTSGISCAKADTHIARLSAATRDRFGIGSSYFIPPTFLCKLRNGITPHVCQVAALSESTGYRFVDWLRFFGFDLHQIPRLQMRLHTQRTVLVTPVESGRDFFLPQVSSRSRKPFQVRIVLDYRGSRYLFAKIGSRDAEIYPRLSAGQHRANRLFLRRRFYGDC